MCNRSYKTLAIIGNGFDRAHGYKTDFKSFVKNTSSTYLTIFKVCCKRHLMTDKWYDFEQCIADLSGKFLTSNTLGHSFLSNKQLNQVFQGIHRNLIDYLRAETDQPCYLLPSIIKHLNSSTYAISFNYTDIAEFYTDNVFYVHGSLREQDIILGYDYRDEPCIAQEDDMHWSKELCRERLAFHRHLISEHKLHPKDNRYKDILADLNKYKSLEYSSKGLEKADRRHIVHFDLIKKFTDRFNSEELDLPNIQYDCISTIAVIGHGIEADKTFIERIMNKCHNVKKIVIYRYSGESQVSFERKVNAFRSYCKNIVEIMYNEPMQKKYRISRR